ncbi:hypothetical protein [Gloeobacter morelensis]|uniref:PPM-type phosphatase domain-containing protein n=1 Tax=Gloeobacter morelensis MG652769 TaxID=2781736 RepID=A0ABY3PGW1_9CYAN|nr:hypothetical protein [Gloeobacter morelensis]UFP92882.1 hypothetical protein ISF26_13730 [Gloeobacter morelensis MG652769]
MYSIDHRDFVTERKDLPQSSVGAPCPAAIFSEHFLPLAYYPEERKEDWDGSSVHIADVHSQGEPCALVLFTDAIAHLFGPPNDERVRCPFLGLLESEMRTCLRPALAAASRPAPNMPPTLGAESRVVGCLRLGIEKWRKWRSRLS